MQQNILQKKTDKQFEYLMQDIRHPSLHAKKYRGHNDLWQARIDRDWRFYFFVVSPHYVIVSVIKHPTLIANGDNDRMVPSSNTYDLAKRISNSELIVYKDAGHGGIFQNYETFVPKALEFLAK